MYSETGGTGTDGAAAAAEAAAAADGRAAGAAGFFCGRFGARRAWPCGGERSAAGDQRPPAAPHAEDQEVTERPPVTPITGETNDSIMHFNRTRLLRLVFGCEDGLELSLHSWRGREEDVRVG